MLRQFVLMLLLLGSAGAADLGESCGSTTDCRSGTGDPNSGCQSSIDGSGNICVCVSGYSDNNTGEVVGGTCVRDLGGFCYSNGDCTKLNSGAECSFRYCKCKTGWKDSNSDSTEGGTCIPNVLGSECSSNDECTIHDTNWVCKCFTGYTRVCQCACASGYTDSNGEDVYEGTCYPGSQGTWNQGRSRFVVTLACFTAIFLEALWI